MSIELRPQSERMIIIDTKRTTIVLEEMENGEVIITDGERRFKPKLRSETSHNNDFSKDIDVKELKRRRKELINHPERGIKLKDL